MSALNVPEIRGLLNGPLSQLHSIEAPAASLETFVTGAVSKIQSGKSRSKACTNRLTDSFQASSPLRWCWVPSTSPSSRASSAVSLATSCKGGSKLLSFLPLSLTYDEAD